MLGLIYFFPHDRITWMCEETIRTNGEAIKPKRDPRSSELNTKNKKTYNYTFFDELKKANSVSHAE